LYPNPLAALHAHRKVMAVIGIYYCPSIPDVARAYSAFELQCKWVPHSPLWLITPPCRSQVDTGFIRACRGWWGYTNTHWQLA
jgi:hypothetical protein